MAFGSGGRRSIQLSYGRANVQCTSSPTPAIWRIPCAPSVLNDAPSNSFTAVNGGQPRRQRRIVPMVRIVGGGARLAHEAPEDHPSSFPQATSGSSTSESATRWPVMDGRKLSDQRSTERRRSGRKWGRPIFKGSGEFARCGQILRGNGLEKSDGSTYRLHSAQNPPPVRSPRYLPENGPAPFPARDSAAISGRTTLPTFSAADQPGSQ